MTNLILIDDDPVFRETMGRRLTREGFVVRGCAHPEQALVLDPSAGESILLDLMLGDTTGLQSLSALDRHFRPRQLVILTGYASIATTVEAMKRGATNYLAKPVDMAQLLQVLRHGADKSTPEPDARRVTPAELEWEHIQRVLLEHDGNISLTARALGMHRRTLQRKLKKHSPF